jgi:hypothetical protein
MPAEGIRLTFANFFCIPSRGAPLQLCNGALLYSGAPRTVPTRHGLLGVLAYNPCRLPDTGSGRDRAGTISCRTAGFNPFRLSVESRESGIVSADCGLVPSIWNMAQYCLKCGDPLSEKDGNLYCVQGDAYFSPRVEHILRQRYAPAASHQASNERDQNWRGLWCPGRGVPLEGRVTRPQGGKHPGDIGIDSLLVHPHLSQRVPPQGQSSTPRGWG